MTRETPLQYEVAAASIATTAATATVARLTVPNFFEGFLRFLSGKEREERERGKKKSFVNQKSSFITKKELAALVVSISVMTVVFSYVETNGLPQFLDLSVLAVVVPSTLLSVGLVRIASVFFDATCAQTCKVNKQFSLWPTGLIMFFISGIIFLFPFSSPGITRYEGLDLSKKTHGLMSLAKNLLSLVLAIPFVILAMNGFTIIGDAGLLAVFTTACYSLVPIEPLPGKQIFEYRKEIAIIALIANGLLLYGFAMRLLPGSIYIGAGVFGAVLATAILIYLRKHSRI